MPKTQVFKTPDSLALRAGSPHPQIRNSLLSFREKKSLYRPRTLPFCRSSFLSLSLCLFLFYLSPVFPFPASSLEKPFSTGCIPPEGYRNSTPPLPSHTAHFTSSHPSPLQLRILEAQERSGSTGEWGGRRGASAIIRLCLTSQEPKCPLAGPPSWPPEVTLTAQGSAKEAFDLQA